MGFFEALGLIVIFVVLQAAFQMYAMKLGFSGMWKDVSDRIENFANSEEPTEPHRDYEDDYNFVMDMMGNHRLIVTQNSCQIVDITIEQLLNNIDLSASGACEVFNNGEQVITFKRKLNT